MRIEEVNNILLEFSEDKDKEIMQKDLKEIEEMIKKEGWKFPSNLEVVRGNGRGNAVMTPAYTEGNKIIILPSITNHHILKRLIYHEALHQCDLSYAGHLRGFKKRARILNDKYFGGKEFIPIEAEKKFYQDLVKDKDIEYKNDVSNNRVFSIFYTNVRKYLKEMGANINERNLILNRLVDYFNDGNSLSIFRSSSGKDSKAKEYAKNKLKELRNGNR